MPWPEKPEHIGHPAPRLDGPAKVTGRARYTTDFAGPGMLFGAIFRSRWASARIRSIDLSRAQAAPGIKAALALVPPGHVARFYGEELGGLAGTSREEVLAALELVAIDAEPLPFTVDELDAIRPEAPRVVAERANLTEASVEQRGEVDAAFAHAAAVVEGVFCTQVELHHPLEPHGIVASFEGDELTARASSQFIFNVREGLASGLGLPQSKVRVLCEHMGGGFGSKIENWPLNLIAAKLARAAGAPVKLVQTRFEQSLSVGNRPSSFQKIRLGADRDGLLTAFDLQVFGSPGHLALGRDPGGSVVDFPAPYVYRATSSRARRAKVATNAGQATWMRAPGHPVACFAMEGILDDLAVKLGLDPVEIRLKNSPIPLHRPQLQTGAERFGWKEKYRAPGSSPGPVQRGVGCACGMWGGGGRGSRAEVQVNPDGTVEVRCGTQDLGTGSRTVMALVAAEVLRIAPEQISVRLGDTRFPPSGVSGGSMTTASVSPAVFDACENALAELRRQSGIDDPRGSRWKEACARLTEEAIIAPGQWREGLSSSGTGGVQFAEVDVDTETGFVKVRRVVCVQDCGLVVNPLTCRSQVNGGIIMGIGFALYEQRVMDARTGVVLNPNLETYKLPGAADIPEIDVTLLNMPERGVIGVGEPVTIPTAAAIANAVANAIGVRVASLPITPDKVLAALGRIPRVPQAAARAAALEAAFTQLAAAPVAQSRATSDTARPPRKAYA